PYLLLGLSAGLLATWFIRLLRFSEEWVAHIAAPVYAKMCVGGLIVGALAVFYPQVCGNGYSTVSGILRGEWVWQALAVILIFKILATTATFSSGAVGGVFTPTLFIGASLGFLFGSGTQHVLGHLEVNPSAFALVGMGAFSGSHHPCAHHGYHHDLRDHARLSDHSPTDVGVRSCLLHIREHRETIDLC